MEVALSVLKTLSRNQLEIAPLATEATYASVMAPCIAVLQAEAYAFHQEYVANNPELYQKQTLERILAGSQVTTPTYVHSLRQLEHLRRSVSRRIEGADLLITPTTPVPPYTIADLQSDPAAERPKEVRMLRNTRPFNMLGMPTISVACGFTVGQSCSCPVPRAHCHERDTQGLHHRDSCRDKRAYARRRADNASRAPFTAHQRRGAA